MLGPGYLGFEVKIPDPLKQLKPGFQTRAGYPGPISTAKYCLEKLKYDSSFSVEFAMLFSKGSKLLTFCSKYFVFSWVIDLIFCGLQKNSQIAIGRLKKIPKKKTKNKGAILDHPKKSTDVLIASHSIGGKELRLINKSNSPIDFILRTDFLKNLL